MIFEPGLNVKAGDDGVPVGSADEDWAKRSAYWLKKASPKSGRFFRRANQRQPLILSGHGVRLRIDRASLLVQNGFTHYPQARESWRFFPGDWRLPSRIVLLDADGELTLDALLWLSRHDVPLVQIDWRGEVASAFGSSTSKINGAYGDAQIAARKSDTAIRVASKLITAKVENSLATLRQALPKSALVKAAIGKLETELSVLKRHPPGSISRLLGIEGKVAYAYFSAWRACPIRWKALRQNPIPDEWQRIEYRTSKLGSDTSRNRNATHPVNAMLNYAYGMLENRVRAQVSAAGLDPTIGLFHGRYKEKHALVYDLMEPLRPLIDRCVLEFIDANIFSRSDFLIMRNGVCRLHPELARAIVKHISQKLDAVALPNWVRPMLAR